MPKVNLSQDKIPKKVLLISEALGRSIRFARKWRNLTMKQLSERVGVSPVTMGSVEHGNPRVSFAVYLTALWVLGMTDELKKLSQPKDLIGETLQELKLPKRIRGSKERNSDDNF